MSTDVLCIGETMIVAAPADDALLHVGTALSLQVGGAESNTAITLRGLGIDAAWAGLLGADRFGDLVLAHLGDRGLDVDLVQRRNAPTGLYVKARTADGVEPIYYRRGSAASTMDASLARAWARSVRPWIVHVSGITAQISSAGREFLDAVCVERVFGDALVSFDVNHRAALADASTASALLRLARASDIVFVGADEAATVWDVTGDAVAALLTGPRHVVVKDGGTAAIEYSQGVRTVSTAPPVEVVEAVGAGDAFAGGWLAAYLAGQDVDARLSAGHAAAGRVLRSRGDVADEVTSDATSVGTTEETRS